jgi:hypothetical protein
MKVIDERSIDEKTKDIIVHTGLDPIREMLVAIFKENQYEKGVKHMM